MARPRTDLLELLRKEGPDAGMDFLREGLQVLVQAVMEAEVTANTGAGLRGAECRAPDPPRPVRGRLGGPRGRGAPRCEGDGCP